jgi:hypothetical protein
MPMAPLTKSQKGTGCLGLGMCMSGAGFILCLVVGAANLLRPHEIAPRPVALSAAMSLPTGSWVTVSGTLDLATIFQPTFLGIGTSDVRMAQLKDCPLVVLTTEQALQAAPDGKPLLLTGVIEADDRLAVLEDQGKVAYRGEDVNLRSYCGNKGVHCGREPFLALRAGDQPASLALTMFGLAIGALISFVLVLVLGGTLAMSLRTAKVEAAPRPAP